MAVGLYDKAFLEKLKKWTKDTAVTVTDVNETRRLFETISDIKDDSNIKLPIIALSRKGGFQITSTEKRPLTYDGLTLDSTIEKAVQLNAIPISIDYQLDVYTRYREEADEYIRNLIFNIINYPTMEIVIPYRGRNYIHNANIRLLDNIEDNSGIPERLIPDQFTRMSISVYIDDAYLWDVRVRDNYLIELNYQIDKENFN